MVGLAAVASADLSVLQTVLPDASTFHAPQFAPASVDSTGFGAYGRVQEHAQFPQSGVYWGSQSFQTESVVDFAAVIPTRLRMESGVTRELAKASLGPVHLRTDEVAPYAGWTLQLGFPHAQLRTGTTWEKGSSQVGGSVRFAGKNLAGFAQGSWEHGVDSLYASMDSVGSMHFALRENRWQHALGLEMEWGSLVSHARLEGVTLGKIHGTGISDSGKQKSWLVSLRNSAWRGELSAQNQELVIKGTTRDGRPFLRQNLASQQNQWLLQWARFGWEVMAWGREREWSAPRNSIRQPSLEWNTLSNSPLAPAASVIQDQRDWYYGTAQLQQWGVGGRWRWASAKTQVAPTVHLLWNEWQSTVYRRTLLIDYLFPRSNVDTLASQQAQVLALDAQLQVRQSLNPRWAMVGEIKFPVPLYATVRDKQAASDREETESNKSSDPVRRALWSVQWGVTARW